MTEAVAAMKRRSFLAAAAAGTAALCVGFEVKASGTARHAVAPAGLFKPNAFVRISADGKVVCVVPSSEMGQGIITTLTTIMADELDADWSTVGYEQAPVDPAYGNVFFQGIQATAASTSVAVFYGSIREAAAAARMMLVQAAAKQWKVSADKCRTENGVVFGPANQQAKYGDLVKDASALRAPTKKGLQLKKPEQFKMIGRSQPRIESRELVTGTLLYGIDFDLPDMLTAAVVRAPAVGAKLVSFKKEAAAAIPGVKAIVELPHGVAVIATSFWPTQSARQLLEVKWDLGANKNMSSQEIATQYKAALDKGTTVIKKGDTAGARKKSKEVLTHEYSVPYLAHAPMEPLNCSILAKADSCEVWVGTQYQSLDRKVVAKTLGLKPESVTINTLHMGGGFGRRASPNEDVVLETAEIVKAIQKQAPALVGLPIKNMWAREDDIQGGFYRPYGVNRLSATIDEKKRSISSWEHRLAVQSQMSNTEFQFLVDKHKIDATSVAGANDMPYATDNLLVTLSTPQYGPTVQWMRSVGNSNTVFAVESFVDELAAHAKEDPAAFRRKQIAAKKGSEPLLAVLDKALEISNWNTPLPKGRGRGIAVHDFWGSKCVQVAEVTTDGNKVHVDRVFCVLDCGLAVNPDGVKNQVEGSIVFGLAAALYGQITLAEGVTQQSNFHDYPVIRMNASPPQIEVVIMPSTQPPGGVGETAVPHIAPAVCNAIFAACGKRVRDLPINQHGFDV